MVLVVDVLVRFLQIYLLLLTVRILLGWFPNVDWYRQPFAALMQISDPYLNLFRGIIPPVGGLDFSPMLAFLLLSFLQRALVQVAPALLSLA
ncbi:MAG TPA: hypothetical protein DCQ32_02355 [Cyanobacteria bacterium UBA8156]|jgi:YggT family protein|nr:hypothetical protein [Cyanobacteria bacterium UBA8156]